MTGYNLEPGSRVRFAYGSEGWAFARKREKVRIVSRVVVCCHAPKPDRLAGGAVHSVIVYLRGWRYPLFASDLVPVQRIAEVTDRTAAAGGAT